MCTHTVNNCKAVVGGVRIGQLRIMIVCHTLFPGSRGMQAQISETHRAISQEAQRKRRHVCHGRAFEEHTQHLRMASQLHAYVDCNVPERLLDGVQGHKRHVNIPSR